MSQDLLNKNFSSLYNFFSATSRSAKSAKYRSFRCIGKDDFCIAILKLSMHN